MKNLIFGILILLTVSGVQAHQFEVSFAREFGDKPFSGNVYVFLSKDEPEPMKPEHWVTMNPVASTSVKDLKAGQVFKINSTNSESFPVAFEDLERGEYFAQIVFDGNSGGRAIKDTVGNYYSAPQKVVFSRDFKKTFRLTADKIIAAIVFKHTAYTKKIELPSPLLSAFYKKPTTIPAVVRLPREYA